MSRMIFGLVLALFLACPANSGSLKDIEHVVIFMQENRSWNSVRVYRIPFEPNSLFLMVLL